MSNTAKVSAPVEITNWRPQQNKGNLKAFFSVVIKGTEINDCRVIQQPGQDWFFSGPQRSYEKDGQTKYANVVKFSEELSGLIRKALGPLVSPDAYGVDDIPENW